MTNKLVTIDDFQREIAMDIEPYRRLEKDWFDKTMAALNKPIIITPYRDSIYHDMVRADRHGGTVTGRLSSSTPNPSNTPKGLNVNPTITKLVTESIERTSTKTLIIENTEWFDNATQEPGQPGVFEVDPVIVADGAEGQRRFSYFNGKSFGPVKLDATSAYAARFEKSDLSASILKFRGLKEQA